VTPVDQDIAQPLMIPLMMVVEHVLGDRPSQVSFSQRYHSLQAFTLDRKYKPLGEGVGVGRRLHLMGTMRVKPFG
jgi:hypothetical protein